MTSIEKSRIAKFIHLLSNFAMDIHVNIAYIHIVEEFAAYMTYCRQLKFDEAPNYSYIRRLFKELYFRCGFENEFIFDWTIQRYRPDKPSTSSHEDEKKSGYQESMKN